MGANEELQTFIEKLNAFSIKNAPKFLTPNSHFMGIEPGHNLDLLEISFDYRIDRTWLLSQKESTFCRTTLKDPSGPPELEIIK